jgi:hypothetical protein
VISNISLNVEVNRSKVLSFGTLNIEGFWRINNELDINSLAINYDFLFLTETFLESFPENIVTSHKAFCAPGVKVSDSPHGRLSGGVAFLVRKELCSHITRIVVEIDNMVVLRISGELLGLRTDWVLLGAYLPPENSKYYEDTDIYNGVALLEDCLLDIVKECGDLPTMICGDLNARTSTLNARNVDPIDDVLQDIYQDSTHDPNADLFARFSKDTLVNPFGRYLLSICDDFGLVIINGLVEMKASNEYTYICENGCSVIDYFLIPATWLTVCKYFGIKQLIETKHAIVEMFLSSPQALSQRMQQDNFVSRAVKYKWINDKQSEFVNRMSSDEVKDKLQDAMLTIDQDMNSALSKFNKCLFFSGQDMKKTISFGGEKRKVWFDLECRESRKVLRKYLNRFKKTNMDEDRLGYMQKRREYKSLLLDKKRTYKVNVIESLQNYGNNPRQFWESIRAVRPKYCGQNSITTEQWYTHFYEVFNDNSNEVSIDDDFDTYYDNQPPAIVTCDQLNNPITTHEIILAIKALKNEKAAGPDGLISEFYKHSTDAILPFLLELFNNIFDKSTFPDDWSMAVLHPLHKKGDIKHPDNYRGISLLNIGSKLYSFILNKRLNKWIQVNNIIGEEQAGFREKRCTADHVFTLVACVQKQLLRHRKLYVAFIDFRKAFDTVSRDKLWKILNNNGIQGKFLSAIKSMYEVVKVRVRSGADLTQAFMCPRGVKQGEVCSPVLFSLLINELTKEINMHGRHGVQMSPELVHILILLFADDVALLSDSVIGLQTQLNILNTVSKRLDLVVNLEKSNIVVFRNGGYLAQNERWIFGNSHLKVVTMYKYLGIFLSTRLSFQPTLNDLAERARKGLSAIIRILWTFGEHSPGVFFKLFDCQIQPILLYGSEIWGLTKNLTVIERVHLSAMKRFLCVTQKAPKHLIYGELGRYPLFVNAYIRCVKYWLRIVHLDESRYPRKAYNMLMLLESQNYSTWISDVRNTLYMYGFGVVWEAQTVGNIRIFINIFKERLIDCYKQDWHSALESHTFYNIYSSYATSISLCPYVKTIYNINIRKLTTRLRFGLSPLKGHYLSFNFGPGVERDINCPFCPDKPESEYHFLLVCPKYNDLRNEFIPAKYYRSPSLFKMSLLLACEREKTVMQLSYFIYKAFDLRKHCLNVYNATL